MFPHIVKTIIHPDEGLVEKIMSDGTVRKGRGSKSGPGYLQTRVDGENHYMYRLIWEHVYGPIPDGQEIDHINGVRDDNRIANLRLVTRSQNLQNMHSAKGNSKSGVKGVCWDARGCRWSAYINHLGRKFHLGLFPTIEEAQAAYAGAAALLHTHNPHAAP